MYLPFCVNVNVHEAWNYWSSVAISKHSGFYIFGGIKQCHVKLLYMLKWTLHDSSQKIKKNVSEWVMGNLFLNFMWTKIFADEYTRAHM